MNNKERLCWVLSLILVAFFANSKIDYIQNLETLNQTSQISNQLKSDQILELTNQINNNQITRYQEGFEAGKTQAMIASMNNELLYNYSDGYHAALNQVNMNGLMANKGIKSKEIYKLFIDILDMYEESDERYEDLLNLVANDN